MQPQHQFQKRGRSGAILACFVGLVGLTWDLEISRISAHFKIPGDLNKAIQLSETFGHTAGVIAIFTALLLIDLENRPKLWRAAAFTLLCGIAANVAKIVVPRYRPHSLDQSPTEILSGWDTWCMPWTGSWFDEQLRSFPSGHSATAVALGIGLTQVYPRGKWFFGMMAAAACFQRLSSSAHFLSDIMGGVLISLLMSLWFWKKSE